MVETIIVNRNVFSIEGACFFLLFISFLFKWPDICLILTSNQTFSIFTIILNLLFVDNSYFPWKIPNSALAFRMKLPFRTIRVKSVLYGAEYVIMAAGEIVATIGINDVTNKLSSVNLAACFCLLFHQYISSKWEGAQKSHSHLICIVF